MGYGVSVSCFRPHAQRSDTPLRKTSRWVAATGRTRPELESLVALYLSIAAILKYSTILKYSGYLGIVGGSLVISLYLSIEDFYPATSG